MEVFNAAICIHDQYFSVLTVQEKYSFFKQIEGRQVVSSTFLPALLHE